MSSALVAPANDSILGIPVIAITGIITTVAILFLIYVIYKRIVPLRAAASDDRFNRLPERIGKVLKIWLMQYRHPRYMLAGVFHIIIFFGFLSLLIRTGSLAVMGIWPEFQIPGFNGGPYFVIKDYAATLVLISCIVLGVRRAFFAPSRYAVPEKYGKSHTWEALLVLIIISVMMITESLFESAMIAADAGVTDHGIILAPLTMTWLFSGLLNGLSVSALQNIHVSSFLAHEVVFFFFMCFLPFGKHFHVYTSILNVLFMRLDKGNIKPVKYGATQAELDELESFGVKKLEDFTWKHMLDFYSCADCGRCSDNCPADAVGRPLSPRFISIKGRDQIFENYPIFGKKKEGPDLIGNVYEEDEIWSCTTCGACEQECPLGIEYIDKIVDLRRGMVEEGLVPQSIQKPLKSLEKRGNPWGKLEKKRIEWSQDAEFAETVPVKLFENGDEADTLYFVDSISSYDDRMQEIARSTARVLKRMDIDFGILGKLEKDGGNEVKRFGEEMLFQELKASNIEAIEDSGAKAIVTSDPHAYNVLKNEYGKIPDVKHISQVLAENIAAGKLKLKRVDDTEKVYTYHDPCYLGRHNDVYGDPRTVLDAVPELRRVEMDKHGDRSFCCGGGGLMLFYEPEEETRMGVLRVEMAKKSGANVIVTACPFCLVNIEDAIKVAGLEGEMEAIDLVELIDRQSETE